MHSEQLRERRAQGRVDFVGTAFVVRQVGTAETYRLENLSAGGALLSAGASLLLRERVRLVIRVAPLPAFEVEARVAWTGEGAGEFGVEFIDASRDVEDAIHDAVVELLGGARPRRRGWRQPAPKLESWLP